MIEHNPPTETLETLQARHLRIGVPSVLDIRLVSNEERELAGKNTEEFLGKCSLGELDTCVSNLDFLYAYTTTVKPPERRASMRDVDVFAQAMCRVLEIREKELGVEQTEALERRVLRSRHYIQNPKNRTSFSHERGRRLLFGQD